MKILPAPYFLLGMAIVTICGLAVSSKPAFGQAAPAKTAEPPVEEQTTRVYVLKFLTAKDAFKTVEALFGNQFSDQVAISVDERLNSLIVRGKENVHEQVAELLNVLDAQSPAKELSTVKMDSEGTENLFRALQSFNLNSAQLAMTSEGGLIIRGSKQDVAAVQELIDIIRRPQGNKIEDVSIRIIWLSEDTSASSQAFEGQLAEQLEQRGFRPLVVLSELEVTTMTGGSCEATGAAGQGDFSCEIVTQRVGDRISLELEMLANYQGENEQMSRVSFTTTLSTPLDRWIVFGVAQRRDSPEHAAKKSREVFLIRVEEQAPLIP